MTARIDADFFTRYSIEDLRTVPTTGWASRPVDVADDQASGRDSLRADRMEVGIAEIAAHSRARSPDEAIFYTSGRTSNEAAFVYQLMVRCFGTNNLPDCSNMCHEPTELCLGGRSASERARCRWTTSHSPSDPRRRPEPGGATIHGCSRRSRKPSAGRQDHRRSTHCPRQDSFGTRTPRRFAGSSVVAPRSQTSTYRSASAATRPCSSSGTDGCLPRTRSGRMHRSRFHRRAHTGFEALEQHLAGLDEARCWPRPACNCRR